MKKLIIGIVLALVLVTIAVPPIVADAQTPKPLDHVVISPSTATIPVGGTKQFTAVGRDSDNVTVTGVSYSWSVVNGGGTINGTGLFTAGSTAGTYANTVQVTAVKGAVVKTAYATVTVVTAGPLNHVVISPSAATIPVGGTKQFTAIGRDSDNVTVTGVSYSWSVVNGGGTINGTGLFTAGSTAGTYANTVQVTAVKGAIVKTAYATIITVKVDEEEEGFRKPLGWSHGRKTGWHNGDTPPGWSHGKKTGWNGKRQPPAWFKTKAGWEDDDAD